MIGSFLQSLTKNFISIGYGVIKSNLKLEKAYEIFRKKFKDPCSADSIKLQKELNKIIVQLDVLSKLLNSILKLIEKILTFNKFLKKLVIALTLLAKLLKLFPLPSRWTTVGMQIKMGDVLAKINFQLKAVSVIIIGIDLIVRYIANFLRNILERINNLLSMLKLLENTLSNCNKNKLSDELSKSTNNLSIAIGNLNTQLGELLKSDNSYKGFTFNIIEEQTTTNVVAKRRYAIAINSSGILTLEGTPSYATDTKVLIDELKLIIDNQNLSGYPTDKQTISGGTAPNTPDLEEDIRDEFGLDSEEDLLEESLESQKDLNELIKSEAGEKKLKEKYNLKQKIFTRLLKRKAEKGNDKAKELLGKINKKEIDISDAKTEWLTYKSDQLLKSITQKIQI